MNKIANWIGDGEYDCTLKWMIIASDDTCVTAAGNIGGPGMGLQFSITVRLRPLLSVLLSNNAC